MSMDGSSSHSRTVCALRFGSPQSARAWALMSAATASHSFSDGLRTTSPDTAGHYPERPYSSKKMVEIAAMQAADWERVSTIYAEGIATGVATFETETPTWEEWDAAHRSVGRLVARADGTIMGWTALAPISRRACYRGVAEVSVYVSTDARGRGIGTALMRRLADGVGVGGIWTLQATVFPENEASLALHRRVGFRIVGRRERIAQLGGVWRDTLLLERRTGSAD
jgi:L-amino acid N-acyltransferase YncA